jgi:hypothetical protein
MLDVLADEADFSEKISSDERRATLVDELMNEFAGVLDAENIRKGTSEAERYLNGSARETWQMPLPTRLSAQLYLKYTTPTALFSSSKNCLAWTR